MSDDEKSHSFGLKNVRFGVQKPDGSIEEIGLAGKVDFKPKDPAPDEPAKMVKLELPEWAFEVKMDDRQARQFYRVMGLDMLWNGWLRLIRRVAGRN